MRILISILFAACLHPGAGAQPLFQCGRPGSDDDLKTDIENKKLKGHPAEVREKQKIVDSVLAGAVPLWFQHYLFDAHGNTIRQESHDDTISGHHSSLYKTVIKYDKHNRIVKSIWIDMDRHHRVYRYKYSYDGNGKLTERMETDLRDRSREWYHYDTLGREAGGEKKDPQHARKTTWTVQYNHDDRGRVNRIRRLSVTFTKWTKEYQWNKKGHRSEIKVRVPKTEMDSSIWLYTYDKDDICTEYELMHDDSLHESHKYDKNNNFLECADWFNDVYVYETLIRKFDADNKEVEMKRYNEDKELIYTVTRQYEYDSVGNWIKQTIFVDSKLATIIERAIEYYQ